MGCRRVIVRGPQDFQVGRDSREEALRDTVAFGRSDRLQKPRHVDDKPDPRRLQRLKEEPVYEMADGGTDLGSPW